MNFLKFGIDFKIKLDFNLLKSDSEERLPENPDLTLPSPFVELDDDEEINNETTNDNDKDNDEQQIDGDEAGDDQLAQDKTFYWKLSTIHESPDEYSPTRRTSRVSHSNRETFEQTIEKHEHEHERDRQHPPSRNEKEEEANKTVKEDREDEEEHPVVMRNKKPLPVNSVPSRDFKVYPSDNHTNNINNTVINQQPVKINTSTQPIRSEKKKENDEICCKSMGKPSSLVQSFQFLVNL